ncbi:MAG: protein kinase [Vicinamibacterales bacterium]
MFENQPTHLEYMRLESGTRVGPYEILTAIGSGGMGDVYRARDLRLDRDVAVKVLAGRLERDAEAMARFEREAKAVAALSHPNVLAIHDFAVENGRPYTVTELLDGESLRERLEHGPISWREAAQYGVGMAEGLAAAHAKGIVHRDLKPENVFLTRDGRIKILDFGLARSIHEAWLSATVDGGARTITASTDTGVILGTLGYMSPEQARGLPAAITTDIFSLGCVLYELISGRRAFDRATTGDTLAALLHADPEPLSGTGRDVPAELSRLVIHCLDKNPDRRFQSAHDVAFALQAVLNDSGIVAGSRTRSKRASRAVAVLPFTNATDDPDLDYLSDGLSESLINALSQLPRLRIVPRAVVFRYKGRSIDPAAAGIELNASTLVTGRVTARGGITTVQAELIDIETNAQLWGQRYVRPSSDVFTVQEELAEAIAEALRGKLNRSRATPRRTTRKPDATAYEHYLRGRHAWDHWTPEGFARAIEHFEAAIERDPMFAEGWAGLGDALGAAGYFGFLPPADAMARAETAATHAIALDPSLAEGHSAQAVSLLFGRWDFRAAERAFARALKLNPRYALARTYYSLYLNTQCRFEEALASAREAERIDPVSSVNLMSVAWALHFGGRHQEAIAQLQRVLTFDPDAQTVHGILVATHERQRDFGGALRHIAEWIRISGLPMESVGALRESFERDGPDGYWRTRLALVDSGEHRYGPIELIRAELLIQLNELEAALDELERATAKRLGPMVFLAADPGFVRLRPHPRYQALCRQVGVAAPGSSS